MGIAGFTTWIKKRYPHAFATLPEDQRVDHVYIDLASTLHMVVRKSHTKAYFHKLLHKRLDEILAATHPTKRVVLALDGPAPLAKLLEQRCAPHCRAAGATEAAGTAPPGRRRLPKRRPPAVSGHSRRPAARSLNARRPALAAGGGAAARLSRTRTARRRRSAWQCRRWR